jgi:hypothetical protein
MSKRNRTRSKRSSEEVPSRSEPWIKKRTGLWVVGIVGLALGIYTGWQFYPAIGFWKALLWGVGSAAAVWLVYWLSYLVNVTVRR